MHDPSVLPGRNMRRPTHPTREEELVTAQFGLLQPSRNSNSGRLGQFELDWPLCLALGHNGPGKNLAPMRDISDSQADKVATPKLAVDGEIEHREVADRVCVLKVNTDRPP